MNFLIRLLKEFTNSVSRMCERASKLPIQSQLMKLLAIKIKFYELTLFDIRIFFFLFLIFSFVPALYHIYIIYDLNLFIFILADVPRIPFIWVCFSFTYIKKTIFFQFYYFCPHFCFVDFLLYYILPKHAQAVPIEKTSRNILLIFYIH